MRMLILGAGGMLGHKLCQMYRDQFDTWGTVRSKPAIYNQYDLLEPDHLLGGVDAFNFDTLVKAMATVQPEVVINCIGIIKQLPTAKNPIVSLTINSLFPHRLADLCQAAGVRLIQISTDCVFSGRKGMYTEADVSDAEDLYGRTKFLGEVSESGCLTLRTSIIGRELSTTSGLVEWFLSNQGGQVLGYTNAIYSGFTTIALAKIIAKLTNDHPTLTGLYQASSDPINKYELLCLMRDAFGVPVEISQYPDVEIDRSLDSNRFRSETGFAPPSWPEMIREMAADPTPYQQWRKDYRDL